MNSAWLLLMVVGHANGLAALTAEFSSQEACVAGAEAILTASGSKIVDGVQTPTFRGINVRCDVNWTCVKK